MRAARGGLGPLARGLRSLGVSANAVTAAGVLLTVAGAGLIAMGAPLAALGVLLVSLLADTVDGQIARASGGGTPLGAFLDSTADRVADGALLGAAAWLGAARGDDLLLASALVALVGSYLVSYTRAKAESLGVSATVGLAPREARSLILLAGLAAWAITGLLTLFVAAVLAIAALASITAGQRVAAAARGLAGTPARADRGEGAGRSEAEGPTRSSTPAGARASPERRSE